MDQDIEVKNRNVIPRLRDFKTTLALGELRTPARPGATNDVIAGGLDEQVLAWRQNRSLSFAADLVGSSLVLGGDDAVQEAVEEAARFILSEQSNATELQKRIARQAIDPGYCTQLSVTDEAATSSDEVINHSRDLVRRLRAQLRDAPRNPIKLVELSREYAVLGSPKKAERTMDMAVALAPANRFVLRSAARLFVHTGEIEKAHRILKRTPSLRTDPWLLAAEMAVASMLERSSGQIHTARDIINSENFNPFEVSELTSALATLEMYNANSKGARKLFRRALRRPTENSVAQVEWASRLMQNLSIEVQQYDTPLNYEALGWSYYTHEEWAKALEQGKGWIFDQPFAVSPVIFTGHVSTILEHFELAKRIYRFGLVANPQNVTLRNNLAFALASNNEPELAAAELEKIDRTSLTIKERVCVTATEGLICFRKGAPSVGRQLYKRAMELAQENNEHSYVFRAMVFLAREEINARTEVATKTLDDAGKEAKKLVPPRELEIVLNKLEALVKADPVLSGIVRRAEENIEILSASLRKPPTEQ